MLSSHHLSADSSLLTGVPRDPLLISTSRKWMLSRPLNRPEAGNSTGAAEHLMNEI